MAKRLAVWILSFLFLAVLTVCGLSCKEEEAEVPEGVAVEQDTSLQKTKEPSEEETSLETYDFEEEEGVEQESPPNQDY